jgi:hypothetical protein
MSYNLEDFEYSIFEKGYPKRIFHKHIVPKRIYYDSNNNIIGFFPSRLEFFKTVNYSFEEKRLKGQSTNLKKTKSFMLFS